MGLLFNLRYFYTQLTLMTARNPTDLLMTVAIYNHAAASTEEKASAKKVDTPMTESISRSVPSS